MVRKLFSMLGRITVLSYGHEGAGTRQAQAPEEMSTAIQNDATL